MSNRLYQNWVYKMIQIVKIFIFAAFPFSQGKCSRTNTAGDTKWKYGPEQTSKNCFHQQNCPLDAAVGMNLSIGITYQKVIYFSVKLLCFSSDCDVWIRCRYHSRRFEKLSCQPTSDGKTRVQTDRNSCSTTKIKCSYWQAKRIWNRWLSSILSSSLNSRLCRISYAYLNDMLPVLFLQRYLEFDAKLEFVLINVNITKYLRTKSATSVNWYVLASAF